MAKKVKKVKGYRYARLIETNMDKLTQSLYENPEYEVVSIQRESVLGIFPTNYIAFCRRPLNKDELED